MTQDERAAIELLRTASASAQSHLSRSVIVRTYWVDDALSALTRKDEEIARLSDELDMKDAEEGLLEEQVVADAKKIEAQAAEIARKDALIAEIGDSAESALTLMGLLIKRGDKPYSSVAKDASVRLQDALTRAKSEIGQ